MVSDVSWFRNQIQAIIYSERVRKPNGKIHWLTASCLDVQGNALTARFEAIRQLHSCKFVRQNISTVYATSTMISQVNGLGE